MGVIHGRYEIFCDMDSCGAGMFLIPGSHPPCLVDFPDILRPYIYILPRFTSKVINNREITFVVCSILTILIFRVPQKSKVLRYYFWFFSFKKNVEAKKSTTTSSFFFKSLVKWSEKSFLLPFRKDEIFRFGKTLC